MELASYFFRKDGNPMNVATYISALLKLSGVLMVFWAFFVGCARSYYSEKFRHNMRMIDLAGKVAGQLSKEVNKSAKIEPSDTHNKE